MARGQQESMNTHDHAASKNKRNQAEQEYVDVIEESVQSTKKRRRLETSRIQHQQHNSYYKSRR
jgi:hypothetical protein